MVPIKGEAREGDGGRSGCPNNGPKIRAGAEQTRARRRSEHIPAVAATPNNNSRQDSKAATALWLPAKHAMPVDSHVPSLGQANPTARAFSTGTSSGCVSRVTSTRRA